MELGDGWFFGLVREFTHRVCKKGSIARLHKLPFRHKWWKVVLICRLSQSQKLTSVTSYERRFLCQKNHSEAKNQTKTKNCTTISAEIMILGSSLCLYCCGFVIHDESRILHHSWQNVLFSWMGPLNRSQIFQKYFLQMRILNILGWIWDELCERNQSPRSIQWNQSEKRSHFHFFLHVGVVSSTTYHAMKYFLML